MSKTRKLLQPQYLKQFSCIGSACEDNCCRGWNVQIDKATYEKYRNCSEITLREQMRESITRIHDNASDSNYARIIMKEGGICPFFNEAGLCVIQLTLGEQYLSTACTIYPRISTNVDGNSEQSLTVSCPEAARLILNNPAAMEFDNLEVAADINFFFEKELKTKDDNGANLQRYFGEIRIFTIALLQNRQHSFWNRLVILGLLYSRLEQFNNTSTITEITKLLDSYRMLLNEGCFAEQLNAIPNNITLQIRLMKELASERLLHGVSSKRFLECATEAFVGLQCTNEAKIEEISACYTEAYQKYYKPFMDKREYMLENYLVNYVFIRLFPFNEKKGIFDNYVMMIVNYAMIKMLLIGMAGFYKEKFSEAQVLKLMQSFSHSMDHDHSFLEHIAQLLESNHCNTMAYMAIMIKN